MKIDFRTKEIKLLSIIICYVLGFFINAYWHFPLFQQVLGLFMIFFLPGYFASSLLNLKNTIKKPFNLLFAIPLSLAIISTGSLFFSRFASIYTNHNQVSLLVAINIVVYIAFLFLKKSDNQDTVERNSLKWHHLAILLLPILIHVIAWSVYPYFPGDDTYALADSLKQSIDSQTIIQPVLERRPLLTPVLILISHGTSIPISKIFLYVIPLVVTLSFLLAANLVNKKNTEPNWKDYLPALIFMASPYLMFQIQYAIPQSFILIWIIPVLLFSISGIKEKNIMQIALACFFSFISINFHELGFVLLLISLIALAIYIIQNYKNNKQVYKKNLLLAFIIFFPYAIILQMTQKIMGLVAVVRHVTGGSALNIDLRWWYVSHYENPDGLIFSFPGIKGALWYGYLGILIAAVFLITLLYYFVTKKRNRFRIEHLPLIVYIVIFFFLAEIYPRIFRVAFLPERAWIFLSIGLYIYITILISDIRNIDKKIGNSLFIVCIFSIIIGSLATIFLSSNRGILMSKGDQKGVDYLRYNTPSNSIIVSTQAYDQGIAVFSDRKFYELNANSGNFPQGEFNIADLKKFTISEYYSQSKNVPAKKVCTVYDLDDNIVSQSQVPLINKVMNEKDIPIYFIYSKNRFEKTSFLGRPEYFDMNDLAHQKLYFDTNFATNAIYDDGKVIIFKIQ